MTDSTPGTLAAGAAEVAAATEPVAGARTDDRVAELDSLRGLAALSILGLHTAHGYFFWAWSAVDLFFILSGYLITGILIANRDTPRMLAAFYVRRALRIWPVYYLALLAAVSLHLAVGYARGGAWPAIPDGQWLSLIFLQYVDRYFEGGVTLHYLWYFDHSWSLAVEEQFYLLWPLVFFFARPRLRTLLVAGGLLLAVSAWARSEGSYFWLLITRIDGLIWGVLLAHLAADRGSLLYRVPLRVFAGLAALATAALLPYLASHGSENLLGPAPRRALEATAFCLLYASLIALVIRCAGAGWLATLRLPLLRYFGRTSFAIYMYQVPIAYFLMELTVAGWLEPSPARALVWILTLACAHLSYELVERRVLALKARFPYRSAR